VLIFVFCISGCGVVDVSQVANHRADKWDIFDPNDYNIKIIANENGTLSFNWKVRGTFNEENNSIDYWDRYRFRDKPVVEGELNGKRYPLFFDTGCSVQVFVQDVHINENEMPVYFPNREKKKSGLAIAKSIKCGSLELIDQPCAFFGHNPRVTLLGVPLVRPGNDIFIGLPVMRSFKYCKFDQIQNRIQFSHQYAFSPENPEEWLSFPFEFGGVHLLLKIQIDRIDTTLMLDTGAGYQLQLKDSITEKLYEKREDIKKAWKHKTRLFMIYMDRKSDALKFSVKNLGFGEHILKKVQLHSVPDNDSVTYDGVIGAELFKKTEMVLDFQKNLMWVKIAKGSAFE
jgi:hypothetical protein